MQTHRQDNFAALSDVEDGMQYWKEDTLVRFLELPDPLQAGSILFQAASYLGAFPFESLAPAILDLPALVKVVALLTGRSKKVLKRSGRLRPLFRAFAVRERSALPRAPPTEAGPGGAGDDILVYDSDGSEDLSLIALEALDAGGSVREHKEPDSLHAHIPRQHMKRLVRLLLALAPLEETQSLASLASHHLSPEALLALDRTAGHVLHAFGPLATGGVTYPAFKRTIRHSLPFLLEQGLPALFSHFLYSKNVSGASRAPPAAPAPGPHHHHNRQQQQPILAQPGDVLTATTLAQLSLFIEGRRLLWRRVRPLYRGSADGFAMGAFETKVCKWLAPTILLVAGTRLPATLANSRQRAFCDTLPARKYPSGGDGDGDGDGKVLYGVFLETPWKASHRESFGDDRTLLFQLEPVHRVWRAPPSPQPPHSPQPRDYAHFSKDDGMGFGVSPGATTATTTTTTIIAPTTALRRRLSSPAASLSPPPPLLHANIGRHAGASMILDRALEFGVFTHLAGGGGGGEARATGGAFGCSGRPEEGADWQDRFEIDEIEVWGCGGERCSPSPINSRPSANCEILGQRGKSTARGLAVGGEAGAAPASGPSGGYRVIWRDIPMYDSAVCCRPLSAGAERAVQWPMCVGYKEW